MGIISSLREKRSSTLSNPDSYLFGGGQAYTGKTVSSDQALTLTAVYACVRILSETVASLPFPVYERLEPKGKRKAKDHYLYNVLHSKANEYMTAFTFREVMMNHLLLHGNAYAEIVRDGGGRVRALYPLNPAKTYPEVKGNGMIYKTILPNGKQVTLPYEKVFHVAGMGFDGLMGYNPIRLAREAIGLGLATEEYGARYFGNGAKPSGVLEHPHTLSENAQKQLRASWNEMHQGLSNQHRVAILEEGLTYKQIGIAPEDSQFLETRKFQVTEIARFFRVPPHMLADLERATFSNIEQQSIDFVTHSIRPWLVRWEQEVNKKLFGMNSGAKFFAEFVVDALLRGDTKSRFEAYSVAIQNGFMNRNEIREKENLNPSEGLDEYLIPMNMIPNDQLDQVIEQKQPQEGRSLETRQKTSIEKRSSITKSYKLIFKRALSDVLKREQTKVIEEAKKQLNTRNADVFSMWISDFYRDHGEYMNNQILPILTQLATQVKDEAAREVGGEGGMNQELDQFVRDYLTLFISRHIGSSVNELKAALENENPLRAIEERFEEWQEDRVEKEAQEETVRASNAFTKIAYVGLGVRFIRWVSDNEPCPICRSLDGKVVGVQGSFIRKGEGMDIGGDTPFKPSRNIGHAPAHRGCECTIVAQS